MAPDPLFTIFNKGIYLYGIFIAIGILLCFVVLFVYLNRLKMDKDVQDFIFFVGVIAIALGFLAAKLYQAFYEWIEAGIEKGFGNAKFDFMNAGITAMGGFIGGAIAFIGAYFIIGKFYFKGKKFGIHKKEFNKIVMVAPCCITIAHSLGRVGCLMAGCCHGEYLGKDYVFGGLYMRGADTGIWGYYVPTQLYEALFLLALFVVLSVMLYKDSNLIMAVYLISYGAWRIFIEFFRTDKRGAFILGLAPSQWQSVVFIAGGVALILIYHFLKIPFKVNYRFEKTDGEKLSESNEANDENSDGDGGTEN